jgi:hypothetical protein
LVTHLNAFVGGAPIAARKPPLRHAHIVVDLIDDGLGRGNLTAPLFNEFL